MRRRANGEPIDDELLARVHAANEKKQAEANAEKEAALIAAGDSEGAAEVKRVRTKSESGPAGSNKRGGGGGGNKHEDPEAHTPKGRWNRIKKMHSSLGGPGLGNALAGTIPRSCNDICTEKC